MYSDESKEQESFVNWMHFAHPDILFSANISGTRRGSKLQRILNGKEAKRMGYLKSIPDITIYEPRGQWHGLLIEMKSLTGSAQKEQKEIHLDFIAKGYCVKVCKGCQEAIKTINEYLNARTGERGEV